MTEPELDKLVDTICDTIKLYVTRELKPLRQRLDALEGRTAAEAGSAFAKALRGGQ